MAINSVSSGPQLVPEQKKADAATDPQFGDVLQKIQGKFGEKVKKPREIKKTLGKDDFLRIMIAQMQNQDPTNPFKAEQMATEIAQFTSVEQLTNVNQNLKKMSNNNRPLERLAMTNMIGKMVTVDRERFPHEAGKSDMITFDLPRDAKQLKVVITDTLGQTIYEKDLGEKKAGPVTFSWDGIMANTIAAKTGLYRYQAQGVDERDNAIAINPKTKSRVVGISFEGLEPVLLVGDNTHQNKVLFGAVSLIEVEKEKGSSVLPEKQTSSSEEKTEGVPISRNPSSAAIKNIETPQFKGNQSAPLSSEKVRARKNQARPNSQFNKQRLVRGGGRVNPMNQPPKEMGFPNGLGDPYKQAEQASRVVSQTKKGGENRGK